MGSLDVLVVGAGKMAQRHAAAWQSLSGGRIAVTDVDPGRADSVAAALGVDVVRSPLEATRTLPVDIIDICVPTPYHAQYVTCALAAGRHVFVEKPLCLNSSEAGEIVQAAEQAGRHVQVGYLFRHHPTFIQVRQWLGEDLLGEPHMVLVRMGGRGSAAPWKHQREAGGGVVTEMVVHKLDLLIWFFGSVELEKVHARYTLMPHRLIDGEVCEADAEDFILAQFQAGSTRIFLQSDMATPTYVENVEIHGANGSIVASIQEGFRSFLWLQEGRGEYESGYHYREFGKVDLVKAELAAFIAGLAEEPTHTALREAAGQVKVLEELRGW